MSVVQSFGAEADSRELAVSIVMPCLNEAVSLRHCIANAQTALDRIAARYGLAGEIVIADNGSTDGSQDIATALGARVVPVARRGYGAALIGGFDAAFGRFLVMGDADGSYDFTDCVAMIGRLIDGADLCMGSRFQGGIARGAMPWKNRYIGNPVLTGILNLFFRSGIGDAHCGLRAIRRDAYDRLRLEGEGMEFASEMVIKAALSRLQIDEVPATLSPDLRDRPPHLRPWRDGWRHLRYLLMLSPTWLFGVPALAAMLLACVIFAMAGLHQTGLLPGPAHIGTGWTILAGFLLTSGHFCAVMALATHLYGVREGYRPLRPGLARWAHVMVLENALLAGLGLIGVAALGLGAIALRWSVGGFAALPSVLPLTLAAATGALGVQTLMGGFLLAIIGGHDARFVAAVAAPDSDNPLAQATSSGGLGAHVRRSPRYALVSVACFVLHNAIMIALDRIGLHYALCLVGSALVLLPVGYGLQSRVTFDTAMTWRRFARYSGALITNYPVSLASLWLLRDALALPMTVAAPVGSLILFAWNYGTSLWALSARRTGAILSARAVPHG
ncbi:glycosyltransferase [Novosphingobium colocasiae]|uniref:glycosyltransferase n=1 Tax=Novosphingobium colocasiae TaxID=1256513 RepID=UPI0035AE8AD8